MASYGLTATEQSVLLDLVTRIHSATGHTHYRLGPYRSGTVGLSHVRENITRVIIPPLAPEALQGFLEVFLEGIHAGYLAAKCGR